MRVNNELATHIDLTQKESGCLVFKVTVDPLNANKFDVYEEFDNQASFDKHQVRVNSSTWGLVTRNVERHYQITNQVNKVVR